jgi:hypothetical protein
MANPVATNGIETASVETTFRTLAAEWKAARGHTSSINAWFKHAAYRAIIDIGEPVIPLLLRELESDPDHWFRALKELTGENPVPLESRANISEMTKCWLAWGKEKGYRW